MDQWPLPNDKIVGVDKFNNPGGLEFAVLTLEEGFEEWCCTAGPQSHFTHTFVP